jgi:hypothetical protein
MIYLPRVTWAAHHPIETHCWFSPLTPSSNTTSTCGTWPQGMGHTSRASQLGNGTLAAIPGLGASFVSDVVAATHPFGVGCMALTTVLRHVAWQKTFHSQFSKKCDGTINPSSFLKYMTTIITVRGDGRLLSCGSTWIGPVIAHESPQSIHLVLGRTLSIVHVKHRAHLLLVSNEVRPAFVVVAFL